MAENMIKENYYMSSEDYLYEIRHNESFFKNTKIATNIKPIWSLKGHDNSIEGVHIINNVKFATVSHDCLISFWNFEKKNVSNVKVQYPILCSSFNKRRKMMVVGLTNQNTNLCIIDVEKSQMLEKINSKSDSIFCLNYFDDEIITCGSKLGSIILVDLPKKKNIYRYEEIEDCISSCSFNTNYNLHFFSTYRGNLSLFDFRTPLPIYKNSDLHSKHSINYVFSFNNYIFSAGSDCLIKKFDLRFFDNNIPLNAFIGHTSPIHFLSFSSDLSFFCSSSSNGSIRLWENTEKIDAVQEICSPLLEEKKNKNKSLLSDANEKKKQSSVRSNSIFYGRSFLKLPFLFQYGASGKNGKEIKNNMRALTPNIPKFQEQKLSFLSKQIFTSVKTKATEEKAQLLLNPKIGYTKDTVNLRNKTSNKLTVGSRLRPSASVNPPTHGICLKPKGKEKEKQKDNIKTNVAKCNETNKNITKILPRKLKNAQEKNIIKSEIEIKDTQYPSVYNTEVLYATVSMLHHKNKVTSMDWFQHKLLSVSWDQTIKCWDLRKYIR